MPRVNKINPFPSQLRSCKYTFWFDNRVLLPNPITKVFQVFRHTNVDLSPTGNLIALEIELLDHIVPEPHCAE